MMSKNSPEPWLSGSLPDVHPTLAPVVYSFQQALEDLSRFTEGLTTNEMWERPAGLPPVGFQLRHIAGSIDRLLTYALERQLSDEQMASLRQEDVAGATREELLAELSERLKIAESAIRNIDPESLQEARKVGRKELPTTLIGLLVHIAEHTQRHVGQAITTAKVVRAARNSSGTGNPVNQSIS
ncbi:MAG: DinB family protein [Bryobacteraceae bacterium]